MIDFLLRLLLASVHELAIYLLTFFCNHLMKLFSHLVFLILTMPSPTWPSPWRGSPSCRSATLSWRRATTCAREGEGEGRGTWTRATRSWPVPRCWSLLHVASVISPKGKLEKSFHELYVQLDSAWPLGKIVYKNIMYTLSLQFYYFCAYSASTFAIIFTL